MLQQFTNPVTGQLEIRAVRPGLTAETGNPHGDQNTNLFGLRGGAGIDPNDGSTWIYGAYGRFPFDSIQGSGQWGTYGANYKMSFQLADPYNNLATYIADVQPPVCGNSPLPNLACSARALLCAARLGVVPQHIFEGVQILRQHGLANFAATGAASLTDPAAFGPNEPVTRDQMARLVILSMMNDADVDKLLAGHHCLVVLRFARSPPATSTSRRCIAWVSPRAAAPPMTLACGSARIGGRRAVKCRCSSSVRS